LQILLFFGSLSNDWVYLVDILSCDVLCIFHQPLTLGNVGNCTVTVPYRRQRTAIMSNYT